MKNRAVVSERGMITIPGSIRKMAHIRPGDMFEFSPEGDRLVLKHLFIKEVQEKESMSENDWEAFDRLVKTQLKNGQYTNYDDLNKAKAHSRALAHKK